MLQMPSIIDGVTHSEYLTVFNAIIFGYVGSEYFLGWGSMIRNRDKVQVYWQHLLWTIFAFVLYIQNWWGVWPRTAMINKSLFYFIYSLVPIFIFYLISVILFPNFNNSDNVNMKEHFYRNTRWLFALFAIYFAITIFSSFVYADIGDVTLQNGIRTIGILLALGAAYFDKKTLIHIVFLIIGCGSLISFFLVLPT